MVGLECMKHSPSNDVQNRKENNVKSRSYPYWEKKKKKVPLSLVNSSINLISEENLYKYWTNTLNGIYPE